MNVGDKILRFKNPEDMSTAYTLEVTDAFEVGPNETYFEITEKQLSWQKSTTSQEN
jgi:hypothetical protein